MALTKIPGSLIDSGDNLTITDLTVTGNLSVTGTSTTLETATLQVEDKNIVLNYGSGDTSASSNGAGITIQDAVDASNDATLTWNASLDKFDLSHGLHIGDSAAIGDATTPALQIGGTTTYRLGMYTTAEGAIIDNANGDDGIIFHTKVAGEAMRINSSGKVGIGTTTPSQLLTVEGSSFPILQISNTDANNPANAVALDLVEKQTGHAAATATFGETGVYGYRLKLDGSSNDLILQSGSQTTVTHRITIERDTGRIGIGTNNPTEKLHIGGTAPGDSIIRQDATSSGTNWEIGERSAGKYQFWEDDGDNVRLTIMSTGNVGIDNTAPSSLLHVGGNGITVNGTLDISRTSIFRTTGSGNYSTSGNASAAHAATFMRGTNAATGDQVGHSYVFDDGGWSATAEIMAEVESATNAYSRLNFKTWNGNMLTRQVITSDGQVIKPYQSAFYARRNGNTTIGVNTAVVFDNTTMNVGADYNTSNGIYTAPYSGVYIFNYTMLIQSAPNDLDIDHYLVTSNAAYIGGMPGRHRYLTTGSTGWGDGYIGMGHSQICYMDAGDTAYVYFSQLYYNNSNGTVTLYGNSGNNWTKFSGYFLG